MLRRLRELRAEWLELGAEKPFHLRIGINTGYCTVGNFGSDDRMDYTIIGSAVNLTARLQSHSEIDGVLLGHETYSLVRDDVAVDEQTPINVKGFAEPVRCYKVLGLYDDLAAEGSVIRREIGWVQGPARPAKAGQGGGSGGFGGDCRQAQSVRRQCSLNALPEPDPAIQREQGQEDRARPDQIADEARHLDAALLADRPHHEIRCIANIGHGSHEHGA